jgi:hypothetical protein
MVKLRLRLRDVPDTIGWDGLLLFINNSSPDSAYYRSCYPEMYAFGLPEQQSAILADIFDLVNGFLYAYACANSDGSRKPKKPKPYPRPWLDDSITDENEQHFGKGAVSVEEFNEFYYGGKNV